MSGMKKVARSRGARLAASLDTGTVLRDLLQTVAPVTPTGMAFTLLCTSAAASCVYAATAHEAHSVASCILFGFKTHIMLEYLTRASCSLYDMPGSSSGSSGTSAKGGLRGSVTSLPPGTAHAHKENSGAWR